MKAAIAVSLALNVALGTALLLRQPAPRFTSMGAPLPLMFDQKTGVACWAMGQHQDSTTPMCRDLR